MKSEREFRFGRCPNFGAFGSSGAARRPLLLCSSPRWPVAPSARTTSVRSLTPLPAIARPRTPPLPAGTNTFADLGWWQVVQDPQLNAYISEALTNNWDIKIAAARVLQAAASLQVTRSQFFPNVNAGGDWWTTRASEKGPTPIPSHLNPQREYGDVFASMPAYEVDLWGKIRRANEASRAQLLATQDAQRTVRQTLVAAGGHGLPGTAGAGL